MRAGSSSRANLWHPAEFAEVTGPGTTMTGRPSRRACAAVLSAPERICASTTTVPRVRAAMTRLRWRKRGLVGCGTWRQLSHQDATLAADPTEQLDVASGIDRVHATGEHRDRRTARHQRAPVGSSIDAVGTTGDDRPPPQRKVGGDLAGHRRAVLGRRP